MKIKTQTSRLEKSISYLGVGILIFILVLPLINLIVSGIKDMSMPVWSLRHIDLIIKSFIFATLSVGIAMIIGSLSALYSFNHRGPLVKILNVLVIGFAFVPNYVYAMAWMRLFRALNQVFKVIEIRFPTQGLLVSIWVQAMAWLPLCFILSRVALSSIDPDFLEDALFIRKGEKPLHKLVLPMTIPLLSTGFGVLWLLTLFDYTVPSLFAENVYVMEIYLDFTTHYNGHSALILSLPLVIISGLFCAYVFRHQSFWKSKPHLYFNGCTIPIKSTYLEEKIHVCSFFMVWGQLLITTVVLLMGAFSSDLLLDALKASIPDILTTGLIVLGVLAMSSIIILGCVFLLEKAHSVNKYVWLLILLPIVVPAPLIGVGLIEFWNHPLLNWIYQSLWMPIMGTTIRFLPYGIGIVYLHQIWINKTYFEMAEIYEENPLRNFIKIKLPLMKKGLFIALTFISVLSFHEIATTILLLPAGKSSLSLRIYNYMHYGASDEVFVLNLLLLLMILSFTFSVTFWVNKNHNTMKGGIDD